MLQNDNSLPPRKISWTKVTCAIWIMLHEFKLTTWCERLFLPFIPKKYSFHMASILTRRSFSDKTPVANMQSEFSDWGTNIKWLIKPHWQVREWWLQPQSIIFDCTGLLIFQNCCLPDAIIARKIFSDALWVVPGWDGFKKDKEDWRQAWWVSTTMVWYTGRVGLIPYSMYVIWFMVFY